MIIARRRRYRKNGSGYVPMRKTLTAALTCAAVLLGITGPAAAETTGWAGLVRTDGHNTQLVPSDQCRGLDVGGLGDAVHQLGVDNSYC